MKGNDFSEELVELFEAELGKACEGFQGLYESDEDEDDELPAEDADFKQVIKDLKTLSIN